jgi:hypothetical protein
MCHLSIFWHNCDHLILMTLTCPFQDLPSHTAEPTSTALLGDPCPLCRQAYPPSKQTLTTHQSLLTAQKLASILNVSVSQPGFLDMVARFFARGDHKRFDQPGPEKAAYDERDEYLDALAEESRLAVQALDLTSYLDLDLDDLCDLTAASKADPESHDGHAESDMSTATIASWDGLNWEGRNMHPMPGYYYYSTGSGCGSGSMTEPEQPPTPTIAPQQLLVAPRSNDIAAHDGAGDGNWDWEWDWNESRQPLQVPDLVPYAPVPVTIPIAMGHGSGRNWGEESMDIPSAHAPQKTLEMPHAMLVRRITQRRNGKKRQQVVSIGKSPLGRGDRQRRRDKREE